MKKKYILTHTNFKNFLPQILSHDDDDANVDPYDEYFVSIHDEDFDVNDLEDMDFVWRQEIEEHHYGCFDHFANEYKTHLVFFDYDGYENDDYDENLLEEILEWPEGDYIDA